MKSKKWEEAYRLPTWGIGGPKEVEGLLDLKENKYYN